MYENVQFDGHQRIRKILFLLILILLSVITYFYKFNIYSTIFSLSSVFIILILELYGIKYSLFQIMIIAIIASVVKHESIYYDKYILEILFIWGLGKISNEKIKITVRSIVYALSVYMFYLIIYKINALNELQLIDRLANAILNALIADLLLFYSPLNKLFKRKEKTNIILKEVIFYILAILVIIPFTLNFILVGRNNNRELNNYYKIADKLEKSEISIYANEALIARLQQTRLVVVIMSTLALGAYFVGRKLIREIDSLVYVISDASKDTESNKNIKWPISNIKEITVLMGTFQMLLFKLKIILNKTLEHNKELHKQAITDELTSIENRLSFNKYVSEEIDSINKMVAIALIDVDKFKDINDTLGHEAGDFVLIEVANRLKRLSYKGVRAFRTGGDEFLLIKILKDGNNLNNYGEDIIRLFSNPIAIYNKSYNVTISVGITMFYANKYDISNIIKEADKAMYEAKNIKGSSYKIFKN